jgi:LmbE family N-acetylglucosaminyl deacetylase
MATIRRGEQTKAALRVGVTDVRFLGYMDGEVEVTMPLRRDLTAVIRDVRPQVVITQSPLRNLDSTYGSHPDHTATGEAAMCAVYPDARNPFAFPDTPCTDVPEWSVDEVWITFGLEGGEHVDITAAMERKIAALLCHESQHRDPDGLLERVSTFWGGLATERGLPDGSYVEPFKIVDTR